MARRRGTSAAIGAAIAFNYSKNHGVRDDAAETCRRRPARLSFTFQFDRAEQGATAKASASGAQDDGPGRAVQG